MKFDKVCFIGLIILFLVCGVISFVRKEDTIEPEDISVTFDEEYNFIEEENNEDIYSEEYIEIYGNEGIPNWNISSSKESIYPTDVEKPTETVEKVVEENTDVEEVQSTEDGDLRPIDENNYIGVVRAIVLNEDISDLPVSDSFKNNYENLRGTLPTLKASSLEIKSDLCSYDNHNVSFMADGIDYNFTFTVDEKGFLDSLSQN